ncbi:MAG: DUF3168 domain-containing protein [Dehalococcoidales bacterium]|nr:DUF3168 domain-containing protein [Dehalococcoidales bacterium]
MLIEHALKTYLEDQAGLTALLGDSKLYYATAPQDVKSPYLVMTKISSVRTHSHDGDSHLARTRMQFSICGEIFGGYYDCKMIAQQLRAALQGKTGLIGDAPGVEIGSCLYDDEVDSYDPDTGLFQIFVDYVILHYD